MKILVVDDDPQLLRLLMRNLQLEGYEVLTAFDGEQALGQVEANSPDLILPQDFLLEQVWGKGQRNHHHLLRVNINRLRRKLESDPAWPRYLLTKHGVGYLLTHPG